MPKIAIIHYKDVDYCGYDAYIEDIVPLSATDWYEVTEEERNALQTYYKPPPRKGYKLKFVIIEQAEKEEIQTQIKNCLSLALEARERQEKQKAKKAEAARKRKETKDRKKREEEQRLLKELLSKHPEVVNE